MIPFYPTYNFKSNNFHQNMNLHQNSYSANNTAHNYSYIKKNNEIYNKNYTGSSHNNQNFDTKTNTIKHSNLSSDYDNYIEFMGIKLYFDDLLILGILFFLYKEEADDPFLFIALILILLA